MFTGNIQADYALLVAIVLTSAILIVRVSRYFLGRFLRVRAAQLNVETTKYYFLKNAISFIVYLLAIIVILYSIPSLKQLGVTLFAGAGIFAAIIGFASQAAFSNIVAGIFIVIFKPFRVGDTVKVGNNFGTIEDINLRHTTLRDIENKRFIIPNATVSGDTIHNFVINDPKIANQIFFGVGYDANLDQVIAIIREEAAKHSLFLDNRTPEDLEKGAPAVIVRVMEWADSSIQLRATVWTANPAEGFELKTDLLKSVKERFDDAGIEIPFPHRTVILRQGAPKV